MNNDTIDKFPDMTFVKQKLYSSRIDNISSAVRGAIEKIKVHSKIRAGETVAVAVGSRGIDHIDEVVLQCLRFLVEKGLKPFIVPSMGSHGGATVKGQKEVLEKLGISESAMNVPIHGSMDVSEIARLSCGLKIFFSMDALEADHIVVINRIKPHTKFKASIESGLCKMLTIGMGKAEGAVEYHHSAIENSFRIIEDGAGIILEKCPVLFGLALLENGYGQLSRIEAVPPSSIIEREKELLNEAYSMTGRIPFDHLDILIVDTFGKDISGIGMDSKVTGRHRDATGDFSISPHVKRIFVRDMSPGSDGNANGIGLADVTTKRLVDSIDIRKTYINAITAISPEKAAIPIHYVTDREALEVCARTIGVDPLEKARIIRIKSTARLEKMQISRAIETEILLNSDLKITSPWKPFVFDKEGNLTSIV